MHIYLFWHGVKSLTHCLLCVLSQLLDVLESYCMAEGLDYSRLDGSTKAKQRVQIVKEFNSSAHTNLCLVSTMWVQQSHSERFSHFRGPVKKSPQNCFCLSCIGTPFLLLSFHHCLMPLSYIIFPLFLSHPSPQSCAPTQKMLWPKTDNNNNLKKVILDHFLGLASCLLFFSHW